jgi:hypothetical protein
MDSQLRERTSARHRQVNESVGASCLCCAWLYGHGFCCVRLSWEAAVDDIGPSSSLMSAASGDDERPDETGLETTQVRLFSVVTVSMGCL